MVIELRRGQEAPGGSWVVDCLMLRHRKSLALVTSVVISLATVSCSPADTSSSSTTSSPPTTVPSTTTTTTTEPTTTTVITPSTTTTVQGDTVTVLLSPFTSMGPDWSEMVFPYGKTEDTLGTAPGGEGLMLGPEYGTQAPDGSWWIFDVPKFRVARFSADGVYLDQVEIPDDVLVDGQYFQYQNPIALDDGSIVATGFRGEANTALMTLAEGQMTSRTLDSSVPWVTTDGSLLFGFSLADGRARSLDPAGDEPADTDWFLARDGSRYMVRVQDDEVLLEMPDIGVSKILQMRFSEDPQVEARAGVEVETGQDGTIFILFYGAPVSDETLGIGGFVTITPEGHVGEAESIADPFSAADPGSPSHLGVTPGTDTPWMMVVGEDGVHVHTRTG
jgi:hypothetical protein